MKKPRGTCAEFHAKLTLEMKKIGLIAGKSRYPILMAEEAAKEGFSIVAAGIKGETFQELENKVSQMHWIEVGELSKLIDIFKCAQVKQVIMAGSITKGLIFKKDIYLDESIKAILKTIKDNRDISILTALAQRFKKEGIELVDSTLFLRDSLPEKGCLTKRTPSALEWDDIKFGWDIAKEIASLDVGMSVVVKNRTVLALEAIEGTDETIKRGALLGGDGCIVVKVSRPNQDVRFDLPVVGISTIDTMKVSKAAVLAIEAKQTLFIDKSKAIEQADKADISIVAI